MNLSNANLTTCDSNLTTETTKYDTCSPNLSTCNTNLTTAQLCGNDVIDSGEQCDQSNLNGKTCVTQGFVGGTLKCGANCQFDTSGCTNTRFTDNGDGTVSDNKTGLMWEQTTGTVFGTNTGKVNDVNNTYTWTATGDNLVSGTAFTSFLATLNNGVSSDASSITGCFANHCDWRLPSIVELQGIIDQTQGQCGGGSGACIDPTFGPTQFGDYWSATTNAGGPGNAWNVLFSGGVVFSGNKTSDFYVRAVRSGL